MKKYIIKEYTVSIRRNVQNFYVFDSKSRDLGRFDLKPDAIEFCKIDAKKHNTQASITFEKY